MSKKYTLEFIKQEYSNKNYEFLDDYYINYDHPHNIKCLKCNHVWGQRYGDFKKSRGCPKCVGKAKHTLEFIKQEYLKKNYIFLDDFYKNSRYKHNVRCLTCNHIWKQSYYSLQQGQGCPECADTKHTLEFIKQEYSKKNYEFLDEFYKNALYNHNIKCLTCSHEWKQRYSHLQQDRGCPKCAREKSKHTLEFIKQKYSKRNYEFLDEFYKNALYKHNIKCLKCGYEWKQTYHNLQQGQGCPSCLHKNEQKCREILEKLTTYKFPKKRFSKEQTDKYIIEYDGYCQELSLAFEYDGQQHYKSVSNWDETMSLEQRQARDLFKTEFCLKNNIKLIRIPYFIEDKEEFIKNELR